MSKIFKVPHLHVPHLQEKCWDQVLGGTAHKVCKIAPSLASWVISSTSPPALSSLCLELPSLHCSSYLFWASSPFKVKWRTPSLNEPAAQHQWPPQRHCSLLKDSSCPLHMGRQPRAFQNLFQVRSITDQYLPNATLSKKASQDSCWDVLKRFLQGMQGQT